MDDNLLLWFEMEATGDNEQADCILELALIITLPQYPFEELWQYHAVTSEFSPDPVELQIIPKDLRRVYEHNHLFEEMRNSRPFAIGTIDDILSVQLGEFANASRIRPCYVLSGDGVSHLHGRFIRHQMPRLEKHLVPVTFDVEILRNTTHAINSGSFWPPELVNAMTHRAKDDVRLHLEAARWFCKELRRV